MRNDTNTANMKICMYLRQVKMYLPMLPQPELEFVAN